MLDENEDFHVVDGQKTDVQPESICGPAHGQRLEPLPRLEIATISHLASFPTKASALHRHEEHVGLSCL